MSKTNKPEKLAFDKATPELIDKVRAVVNDANQKHTYSVSRIYAAHNTVFGLNEQPQTCSSCLTTRARNLGIWLADYDKANPSKLTAVKTDGKKQTKAATEETKAASTETPAADESSLETFLGVLGIHAESTDEERAEALGMVAGDDQVNTDIRKQAEEALAAMTPAGDETKTEGPLRLVAGELEIDFTPSDADPLKGTVKTADGASVKTGTYELADGRKLAVSVGGKSAIKA